MQDSVTVSTVQRVVDTLRLDHDTFQTISMDRRATSQAVGVVAIAALIAAFGFVPEQGALGFIGATTARIAGWFVFSLVVAFLSVLLLPDDAFERDFHELLRPLGFAQAPNVLGAFMAAGGFFGQLIPFVGSLWAVLCIVAALKAVLSVSTARAIGIGLLSGIITFLVLLLPTTIIIAVAG